MFLYPLWLFSFIALMLDIFDHFFLLTCLSHFLILSSSVAETAHDSLWFCPSIYVGFYCCTILEMNTHSVYIIFKIVPFFPNKVSERKLLKISEVRWLRALRILVFCPLTCHSLSAHLVIALGFSIENYWQTWNYFYHSQCRDGRWEYFVPIYPGPMRLSGISTLKNS